MESKNSDCPTLIEINVKEEFIRLTNHAILTESEIIKLKKIAREASFINLNK